ncbi:HEAT repeat domain-containing protein [Actinoplanes sp. URMC 104]|uniref:HEAT repeat domain-containing protein n=1 Tax=Actinoplanes sp. URMC 104 TaxID=3423409 RepID=UPI003F1A2175
MSRPVVIAHAAGDEQYAETLADSITAAGYAVVHAGTVLVGDSIIEEVSRALSVGAPIVLCGTIRAMGTPWAHRVVNAARGMNLETPVYGVAIEQDAYLQPLSLDGKIAQYWRDPAGALEAVVTALLRHYPISSIATPPASDGMAAVRRYRDLLLGTTDIINLANLPADRRLATQELALRNLFLPLTVRADTEPDATPPSAPGAREQHPALTGPRRIRGPVQSARVETTAQPPGVRLEAARRLVVLGHPGSGKTTLLRWMATAYLLRLRDDPAWHDLPGVDTLPDKDWLPILVRCRDLGPAQLDGTFEDVLLHTLRRAELSPAEIEAMRTDLDARLAAGTALVLVDGLDEISDARSRTRFCESLERIHLSRPRAPMVITSRIVGYREMSHTIGRGFEHVEITELDRPAKDDFIRRWCSVTEPPERRKAAADELIADVHGTDRVEQLTNNPMLLTTLALVKRSVGKLPDHRADLYGHAVRVLLSWRSEVDDPISPREADPQLQYLAYAMTDRGAQQLTEDEMLELLEQIRTEYPQLRPLQRHDPADFLRLLERRTSLVIEKGHVRRAGRLVPLFEFRHLTFQEYLTAQAMVQGHFPGRDRGEDLAARVGRLAARARVRDDSEDTWQEVIRLCVSLCHGDDVDRLLGTVLAEYPVLAARCLEDEPNAGIDVVGAILHALVRAVPADARPDSPEAMAINALSRTTWSSSLRDHLLAELRLRGPGAVPLLGRLIGQAFRPASGHDLTARQAALLTGLRADGDQPLVAALVFAQMTSEYDDPIMLPTADLLALLKRPDPIVVAAVAWAMAMTQPPSGGGWWPSDEAIDQVVSLAPTSAQERSTLLSLIDAVGPRRWPDAAGVLGKIAQDHATAVRSEAVRLLGYVGQEAVLPILLAALVDREVEVRESAASGLLALGSSASRSALMAALGDAAPNVRAAAASALGALADTTTAGELIAALDDPASSVRSEVIRALGTIGDSTTVDPLLQRFQSPDNSLPERVLDALRRIGDDRVVPPLVDAFDDLPESTAPWAFFTFDQIPDRRALDTVRRFLTRNATFPGAEWAVLALGQLMEADLEDRTVIESALASSAPETRRQAVWANEYIGDDEAARKLACLVADESAEVRAKLADALSQFDGESALAANRRLAADEDSTVRAAAMKAINSACTNADFNMLAMGLRDPYPQVRQAAALSMKEYDEDRARDLLIATSHDPVSQVRRGVALALRQPCGRSTIAGTLRRLAEDQDPSVRAAAVESLGDVGIGPGTFSGLVRSLRAEDALERIHAAKGLGLLLDDRAIEPLANTLDDPQPEVRRQATIALGNLASEHVVAVLTGRPADPAPRVRRAVADALAAGAVPACRPTLRTLLDDSHPHVRAAAADAIGQVASPGRVDDLLPLLADSHPLVRRNALLSLDDDGAIGHLIRYLDDPDKRVREAAMWTLGVVGARTAAPYLHAKLSDLYGSRRATALEALSRIEGPDVIPLLTDALDDPHSAVRQVAVREFRRAQLAVPKAPLRTALTDPESAVRREAARTVAGLNDRAAIPLLIDRLEHDPSPWVRVAVVGAIVRLDARMAQQPLSRLLNHPNYYLRETAAWALASFGEAAPMAELRRSYGDLTAAARWSLIGPLARLGDPHAQRLMRIGLTAPSRSVRREWMGIYRNELRNQFERDLLTRYGDGGAEIDPQQIIDRPQIERMARALWRTPTEIRQAYLRLSTDIPLAIAG